MQKGRKEDLESSQPVPLEVSEWLTLEAICLVLGSVVHTWSHPSSSMTFYSTFPKWDIHSQGYPVQCSREGELKVRLKSTCCPWLVFFHKPESQELWLLIPLNDVNKIFIISSEKAVQLSLLSDGSIFNSTAEANKKPSLTQFSDNISHIF